MPITTPDGPLVYYRAAPDLDLAWTVEDGAAQLCWQTPIEHRCIDEPRPLRDQPTTSVIASAPAHVVVLVTTVEAVGPPGIVVVDRAGHEIDVEVVWSADHPGLGIARLERAATEVAAVRPAG